MSTAIESGKHMIAVCQLTCKNDLNANFEVCQKFVKEAVDKKCKMAFFPECFDYIGENRQETIDLAFNEDSEFMNKFKQLAKDSNVWLSLGGFHNKSKDDQLPFNTHIVIDSSGKTQAQYHKLHLFDLDIPGRVRLMESEFSREGTDLVKPVQTPVGNVGLSICYDVRFPELGLWNRYQGAHVLTYPSSFTINTGLAHWESLLRARAIETQSYVVAAAQTGKHNEKRSSYGHSMVVDPWGAIVSQCSERVDICFAEIDLDYVKEIRQVQPVIAHRRSDLYSIHYNSVQKNYETLKFAEIPIPPEQIFYRSEYSYSFVNLKPVVPGHVLVSPIRQVKRLTDLDDKETADLFIVAKKIQKFLETYYKLNATTVCVQDGADAGQTVPHVHVHILPRKKGDVGDNSDNIYNEIEKERKARDPKEMAEEAKLYRDLLYKS
ncbi:unnamed protein product [Bursaphelenchus okinawaensis]|uniref:Nitrilase and fragile histidine triad fusion protein NitFhit n=1 Tax=Bursaphelenchus okinawaensis TaxID=465554 RepID=A0A811KV57_9BILA|nr:unnamed protein product [Bursaphelenchus okinawaensis]CAG9112780.1 unnamed protein product [Bursaphelenchus okinawaensis]